MTNKKAPSGVLIEIFARIWSFWGLISFAGTFLIIVIPSLLTKLIKDPKGMWWFISIARIWNWTWLHLIGCPVTVKGKENFAKGQTYVVTCNHNAMLDVPMSAPFIPGPNQTIAKKEFTKVPLFGFYYARGSVLVDRKSDGSRRRSFEDMKAALRKGFHMCIFPEGTRNRSNEPLKPFFDGAFKLAVDTKTSVIPAVILHTKKAMPTHKVFYLMPHPLEIHFLPPISSEGLTTKELKDKVFQIMWDYYKAND
jgi:1-acyl-sn-glycerol-3-phosphate acyltransferase